MKEGSIWEVKLLRYVCIGGLVIIMIVNLDFLINIDGFNSYAQLIIALFSRTFLTVLFLYTAYRVDQKSYTKLLLFFILGTHILTNIMFIGDEFEGLFLPFDDRIGEGRWLDYIFRHFPIVSILALAFLRIWAVLLWLFLSTFTFVRPLVKAFQNPLVYLENEWEVIINDGFAVNAWMLEEQIKIQLYFIIGIVAIFWFNRKLVSTTIETEKASLTLSRYFSPEIQKEIQSMTDKGLKNEPLELKVAIIFTDLVGFTKLSEKMNPKDVLSLLNEYQSLMIDAIFKYKGTVDKFIGDAVMANFGTPRSHGNDAQNAFDCAIEMNEKLDEWNLERSKEGLPKIKHRIGIHYGDCVVGNMGNERRMEFAVIGDAVNVASRICDACKEFDTNFLVSADLAKRVKILGRHELVESYSIRGRAEPINLIKIYSD